MALSVARVREWPTRNAVIVASVAILDASLISGPLPFGVAAAGVLGILWLVAARRRRHLTVVVPVASASAASITVLAWFVIERVWRPFPDPIETAVYVWIGVAVFALATVVPRSIVARRWWTRILSVAAAVAVVLAVSLQVNSVFDAYPTVRTALGVAPAGEVSLQDVSGRSSDPITADPLQSVWTPPENLPTGGRFFEAAVPATASNFVARDAIVYLPPAYFAPQRPLLPVLVLLAGQPGSPEDWLNGGTLVKTMDGFAADHGGLSPIVVVADGTGSLTANPLCVDSPLGNVATYLSTDVPDWVTSTLQVDENRAHWAIGGLSYGGTCAMQMATNHPETYPTFLVLSGQAEPTLGDRERTLDAAFGGSAEAFAAVDPLDLMASRQYPDSAGVFVVGESDPEYRDAAQRLFAAAQAAGMDVQYVEVPGGHSFEVWSAGLQKEIGWLSERMGIVS